MGLFDILFGNKKEEERLKNERQAEIERQRIAEEKRIAVEREKRLAENRRKEAESHLSCFTSQKSRRRRRGYSRKI